MNHLDIFASLIFAQSIYNVDIYCLGHIKHESLGKEAVYSKHHTQGLTGMCAHLSVTWQDRNAAVME